MKKILALLMVFMLSFSLISCGDNDNSKEPADENITDTQIDEDAEDAEDAKDGEDASPEVLNPEDLTMKEDASGYEMETKYDYGIRADKDYKMDDMVEKVSYKDLGGLQPYIESKAEQTASKVFGSTFSFMGDYEAEPEMDFDKLVYVGGVEGTEMDNAYIESGVYHEKATGEHHQYTSYTSKTYYSYSDEAVEKILKVIENAYGIKASERKVKKAVKQALDTAKEMDDFCSLVEKTTIKGKGYTETITMSVDGFVNESDEGGDYGFYIYVDRDRLYK